MGGTCLRGTGLGRGSSSEMTKAWEREPITKDAQVPVRDLIDLRALDDAEAAYLTALERHVRPWSTRVRIWAVMKLGRPRLTADA